MKKNMRNHNRDAKVLAKWLKETAEQIFNDDIEECASWEFEGTNYSLSVGWLDGYDEADDGYYHSKTEPTWVVNAAIKIYNPYDCASFMHLDMPWFKESGEVWDSSLSLGKNDDYLSHAKFFLKELKGIEKEFGSYFEKD